MRKTIASYVESFRERGSETWLAHARGLRTNRWSYERVARTAYRFARELEARGVGKGERVLIWAENSAEWVAASVFIGTEPALPANAALAVLRSNKGRAVRTETCDHVDAFDRG